MVSCGRQWSVSEVVLVICVVCAVVALTVMRVLLFLCELRVFETARVIAMLVWGVSIWVVQVLCLVQTTCYR